MIGQCLSNKNESATMSKSKKFLDLNKAMSAWSWNRLAKKCGAELKNVEQSSLKHLLNGLRVKVGQF